MALRHLAALTIAAGLCGHAASAFAAPDDGTSADDRALQSSQGGAPNDSSARKSENHTVIGRRSLPPGYSDVPSNEINHGPDPDHLANVHRDAVTGSNLSNFGTSYQDNGPFGSGQLGDATGNGWVTPHGNGD